MGTDTSINDDSVRAAIEQTLRPGRFFLAGEGRLKIDHQRNVSLPWEVFRGHLLDESQTRAQRTFESWNVFVQSADGGPTEPLLAVLLAPSERVIYVTRSIFSYVQEPYVTRENVVLAREIQKWVRELVDTIDLTNTGDGRWSTSTRRQHPAARALERELGHDLLLAVIGTSRLPVTSVESPLPGFLLGYFGYFSDALMVDSLLRAYLQLIERHPDMFQTRTGDSQAVDRRKRHHRRALRQGWLIRKECEGHPVPDMPTSPGENRWVLPEPFNRVPDQQLVDSLNRPQHPLVRRMFDLTSQGNADLVRHDPLNSHGRPSRPYAAV